MLGAIMAHQVQPLEQSRSVTEIERKARSVKGIRKDFRQKGRLSGIFEEWGAFGLAFGEMPNIVYRNLVEIRTNLINVVIFIIIGGMMRVSGRLENKNCDDSQF